MEDQTQNKYKLIPSLKREGHIADEKPGLIRRILDVVFPAPDSADKDQAEADLKARLSRFQEQQKEHLRKQPQRDP